MLKSLKRLQLKRRGFAAGRRRRGESEWLEKFESSGLIKALIFVVFFAALTILMQFPQEEDTLYAGKGFQGIFLATLIVLASILQFFANHPLSFSRNSRAVLVFGAILTQLSLIPLFQFLVHRAGMASWQAHAPTFFLVTMPYLIAPATLSVLLGRRQAVYTTVTVALLGGMLVSSEIVFPFILASLLGGLAAVYATHEVRRRTRIIRAGAYVAAALILLMLATGCMSMPFYDPAASWTLFGAQSLAAIVSSLVSASLVSGFLPLLENIFRITTKISWIELTDPNHPLLRRMTLEAPGTYVHSLAVANLSAAAAEEIGANASLCRACSYFHDVGKLVKPNYFIENCPPDCNPHDEISPNMSALVIIAHVKEGVDLAVKHKLKPEIIDVIQEHHGTSLVYFFYRRALDLQEAARARAEAGEILEEDIPEVDPESFRYPGSIPQTRESAIISLADAVESASRSLEKSTPQRIEQLVDEIFLSRLEDGQLDECDLTLTELRQIKDVFATMLTSMLHQRVSYPKGNGSTSTKLLRGERKGSQTTKFKIIDAA